MDRSTRTSKRRKAGKKSIHVAGDGGRREGHRLTKSRREEPQEMGSDGGSLCVILQGRELERERE